MAQSFIETELTNWLLRQTASNGLRRVSSLGGAIASEIGNVRTENQDRAIIAKCADGSRNPFSVVAIADGIGGMKNGTECASIAIGSFVSELVATASAAPGNPRTWAKKSAEAANKAVFTRFGGEGGTTFCAVVVAQGISPIWVSAGDSRIYSFYGKRLKQVSTDDTIAGQLRKDGRVSPEHSKLLQFVGMGKDFTAHVESFRDERIGTLILTTDGVHYLAENQPWFENILGHASDPGVASKRLVDLAKWCGGPDNATIVMLELVNEHNHGHSEPFERLVVWDSFGELHLQTPLAGVATDNTVSPHNHENILPLKEGGQLNVSADEKGQSTFEKKAPLKRATKKRKPAKKKQATKPIDNKDAPQLDISFSDSSE